MGLLGLPVEMVKAFVEKQCIIHHLSEEQSQMLQLSLLASYDKATLTSSSINETGQEREPDNPGSGDSPALSVAD
jgi:hypothetical protein